MRKCTRVLIYALLIALLVLAVAGCAKPDSESTGATNADAATLQGGSADLGANVNLHEVSVQTPDNNETLVQLSFIDGSSAAGVEESELSNVPEYSIRQLSAPPRLELSLHTGYMDYARTKTVLQGSVLEGIFDCARENESSQQLYFQLNTPVDVTCKADGSTLLLTLTPKESTEEHKWFTALDAMSEYVNGTIPADLEFTPTLCEDLANIILISKPFTIEEDANSFAGQAKKQLASSVPESALYVFEMAENSLPPCQSAANEEAQASTGILKVDGTPRELPVFLENGRYLATAPDGTVVYSVPTLPEAGTDSEQLVKQELWARSPDGTETQYTSSNFYDICEASFSPDGRYLGILDAQASSQILYVHDTTDSSLRNLGEEGLGDFTVSFVWDPDATIIYAMTGTNENLQLLRYDFAVQSDSPHVSSVEERNGSDSQLAYANGRLYFADQTDHTIYTVDPETGARTALTDGVGLATSNDGKYIAVLSWGDTPTEEEISFNLSIAATQTGETLQNILQDVQIENFWFGPDSDNLYFTTPYYEGVDEAYPFALLCHTVSTNQTRLIGYSKTETFVTAPMPGNLYLIYYETDEDTNTMIPMTYLYEPTAS